MKHFKKILVANRGEIAVRIQRTAQGLGIRTVAVYAADDASSLHVTMADEAYLLPGHSLQETYLNIPALIQIALEAGVEAIHPGYGFLAEHAGFAADVDKAGLVFIGPRPEQIRLMGEKNKAYEVAAKLGVPVLPSARGTVDELLRKAPELGFPLMVKASAGGGGKGMQVVTTAGMLHESLRTTERMAQAYFGNPELFIEKYIPHARHVEVQVAGDRHGNFVHLLERECSVQRHFQKVVEEAPSPSVSAELRSKLSSAAVSMARSIDYENVGTVEFLLGEQGDFYFLEMNTRIQVEHPVTEMITGVDVVEWQLLIAAGQPLPMEQNQISGHGHAIARFARVADRAHGHAIELRVCAEDPEAGFRPSGGIVQLVQAPSGQNIRWESYLSSGHHLSARYDSLLGKLIVWAPDRNLALQQAQKALAELVVSGPKTNISYLVSLLKEPDFAENRLYTAYLSDHTERILARSAEHFNHHKNEKLAVAYLIHHFLKPQEPGSDVWSRIGYWRIRQEFEVKVEDDRYRCTVLPQHNGWHFNFGANRLVVQLLHAGAHQLQIAINGSTHCFWCVDSGDHTRLHLEGFEYVLRSNHLLRQAQRRMPVNGSGTQAFHSQIHSDLYGKVLRLDVKPGDAIREGSLLLVLESMKSEFRVISPSEALVKQVHVTEGSDVHDRQLLIELEPIQTIEHT